MEHKITFDVKAAVAVYLRPHVTFAMLDVGDLFVFPGWSKDMAKRKVTRRSYVDTKTGKRWACGAKAAVVPII